MDEIEQKGLPYACDYAKSGRAVCKQRGCEETIDKGELRISVRVHNRYNEGRLMDVWFHDECFWESNHHNISEASIRGFEHLRWKDQEKIRANIKRKEGDEATRPKNPRVEYAASGRGACVDCKKTISEGELRIKYKSSYHHPQCLANKHVYRKTAEEITDFDDLADDDQEFLRQLFTGPTEKDFQKEEDIHDDSTTLKELKRAVGDVDDDEERKKLEDLIERKEALKKQTDLIWEVKGVLESAIRENNAFKGATEKKKAAANLLQHNGGCPQGTTEDHLQLLADIIVFGAFEPCPKCGNSNFYYSLDRRVYQCGGDESGDLCLYSTRNIKRRPFKTDDATSDTELSQYDGKIMLSSGRVFSKTVENHVEEEKMVRAGPTPIKKINPSRKRKSVPEGVIKSNGFAVDGYFDRPNDFHVYVDDDGVPHQFLLHKKDTAGNTKFYLMQLLESDDGDEYRVFRRYGAVLTDATKDMTNNFGSLKDALELFKKMFHDKMNGDWSNRAAGVHNPKQYKLVEWDTPFLGTYGRTSEQTN